MELKLTRRSTKHNHRSLCLWKGLALSPDKKPEEHRTDRKQRRGGLLKRGLGKTAIIFAGGAERAAVSKMRTCCPTAPAHQPKRCPCLTAGPVYCIICKKRWRDLSDRREFRFPSCSSCCVVGLHIKGEFCLSQSSVGVTLGEASLPQGFLQLSGACHPPR